MNKELIKKRKRLLAMLFANALATKKRRLQLLEMHQRRKKRLAIYSMLMHALTKSRKKRALWMKERHGRFWEINVPKNDDAFFKESFRMSRLCFEILCEEVKAIAKRNTSYRECIPLKKRVAIALYTLRSSAEYATIGRLFGVSKTMVSKILKEFCLEVWNVLAPKYLKSDFLTQEKVEECIKGFSDIGFPQCLGAIDVCHVEVKPAAKDETYYYNYNGWYSTILFALVDYRHRFMYINVGAPGRCNDSQIYENSLLKKALTDSPLLGNNSKVINGVNVPVVLLGDSAFRFSNNVMKQYTFSVSADERENIFNYHLSKARRMVEDSFEQVKARFRRIGSGIENGMKNVNAIIKCCCVLHNFLNEHNDNINAAWMQIQNNYQTSYQLTQPEVENTSTDHDASATQIRNAIATLLCSEELSSENEGIGVDIRGTENSFESSVTK